MERIFGNIAGTGKAGDIVGFLYFKQEVIFFDPFNFVLIPGNAYFFIPRAKRRHVALDTELWSNKE